MAMAKDLITNVLRTSLLRFIKDASGEQLHLRHLLSGTVELGPNVALAEEAIQQVLLDIGFPASVEVVSAHADAIRVHIPWAKLLGQSSRLVMGELTVIHNVEALAQVLEGANEGNAPGQAFLSRQRERLEAMAEKRSRKPAEGVVRQLTLVETVVQGLRTHVNRMRLEIFRDCDEGAHQGPPSVAPYLTLELQGFTVSPCTPAQRPTMELAEARVDIGKPGHEPPEPLIPWSFHRIFRLDSAQAWVLREAGKPASCLPWQSQATGEWTSVAKIGAGCLRTSVYQASARSKQNREAFIVEEGGALIGVDREIEMDAADDPNQPAFDIEMEGAMALELAELGGHFIQGFGVTRGFKQRRIHELLPAIAGLGEEEVSCAHNEKPTRLSSGEIAACEEPVKAVDNFLREGLRVQRGSQGERRRSSGSFTKAACRDPLERVLISGWLTKRAKLRPFQDSWQERWHGA
ncbi:unnamed protein product [Effrenium voratum]|uniref:Chorein N-terminal domain-containing protein n=1 Tax=Effrenium voratum TaxID=2562239 RepID=A0AA36NFC5_9DINO|nr:unnamed protein product [Effrenium voratum]